MMKKIIVLIVLLPCLAIAGDLSRADSVLVKKHEKKDPKDEQTMNGRRKEHIYLIIKIPIAIFTNPYTYLIQTIRTSKEPKKWALLRVGIS
jgi:hypothetical protein